MKQCDEIEIKLLTGEPLDDRQIDHLENCDVCTSVAAEHNRLAAVLQESFAIPAPSGLQTKLQRIPWQKPQSRFTPTLKIAASLVLAVGLVSSVYFYQRPADSWDQVVYEHVMHEPESLHLARVVDSEVVGHLTREFGMQLDTASLGNVNYITLCPIAGTQSLHMVFQGVNGPVTLLYMPGKHIEADLQFNKERFNGRIKNLKTGVIALVGEDDEPMNTIENRVSDALTWL